MALQARPRTRTGTLLCAAICAAAITAGASSPRWLSTRKRTGRLTNTTGRCFARTAESTRSSPTIQGFPSKRTSWKNYTRPSSARKRLQVSQMAGATQCCCPGRFISIRKNMRGVLKAQYCRVYFRKSKSYKLRFMSISENLYQRKMLYCV